MLPDTYMQPLTHSGMGPCRGAKPLWGLCVALTFVKYAEHANPLSIMCANGKFNVSTMAS